jgi:two-component system, LytTR family, sensor kinase
LVVFVFASQWYAYDAGHGVADPFVYYLGWACYMWGVLTPVALWLAHRRPIETNNWKRAVPLHLAASILLTVVQLSLEAAVEWLRTGAHWPLAAAVRHYLTQHTQISLVTYWALVGAAQFYRLYDQARTRQLHTAQLEALLAEAQLEALRTQLQPHFVFNTLQAAATLIYDDPEGAEDVLQRLSQLLRVSFNELHVQEIPLRREIEFLEHYVNIQQRRFGERLRFSLQIDSRVLDCAVPTLILQPVAENAVRHGVGKHKENDVVTIEAFRKQDTLYLKISNLTSVLDDTPERLFSRGVGLSNTRRRLEQLYGQRQELDLFNLKPRGVCVRLSIPAREMAHDEDVPAAAMAP